MNYLIVSLNADELVSADVYNLLGNIFMLQDTSAAGKPNIICTPFLGNSPLWSLSYEWSFYMLFFVITRFVGERASLFVYGVGIVSAITYLIFPNFLNRELMYLVISWVGADFAKLYINNKKVSARLMRIPLCALFTCIIILAANAILHGGKHTIGESPFLELRHFPFAFLSVIVAFIWSKFNWFLFNNTIGLFEIVAPISFGVYISHWFLLSFASYFDGIILNDNLRLLCYILVCGLFSYFIERVIYLKLNKQIMR